MMRKLPTDSLSRYLRSLPAFTFLTYDPGTSVASVALGLTLYLDEPEMWGRQWAGDALERYLVSVVPASLPFFTTSRLQGWRRVGSPSELVGALRSRSLDVGAHHLLEVRIANDPGAPSLGFRYREVDGRRAGAPGYLQLLFPLDSDPDELVAFALELARSSRILCGVGGYTFSWNPAYAGDAFEHMYSMCKRFLGLDVQYPELYAWHVRSGLPGSSWLNLIGRAGVDLGIEPGALRARRWSAGIEVLTVAETTLVRAGRSPEVGDVNAAAFPSALAEVARALRPWFFTPPDLPGPFTSDDEGPRTDKWLLRFCEPDGWSA